MRQLLRPSTTGSGARARREESGQTLVEYALIIAVVSLGSLVALGFLSGEIQGLFSKAGSSINGVQVASGGSTTPPPPTPIPPVNNVLVANGPVNVVGGGTAVATIVGTLGGQWFSQSITGVLGSPNIPGGGVFRTLDINPPLENPSNGSACGFTLDNTYAFNTGKTWHLGAWDDPRSSNVLDVFVWACY